MGKGNRQEAITMLSQEGSHGNQQLSADDRGPRRSGKSRCRRVVSGVWHGRWGEPVAGIGRVEI